MNPSTVELAHDTEVGMVDEPPRYFPKARRRALYVHVSVSEAERAQLVKLTQERKQTASEVVRALIAEAAAK